MSRPRRLGVDVDAAFQSMDFVRFAVDGALLRGESAILHGMSRVFLSYSRADEEFATRLRRRLESEAPDISLWQDRTQMEGGVGWWPQIQAALERVEFMILVMSKASVHSETVRKEWRYARQQGVTVFPIVAGDIAFEVLPKWMSSVHFFDLDREWPTFLQYLRSPPVPHRVPFMAPDLPAGFVERAAEFAAVRDHLVECELLNSLAGTTALYGTGGFGKTTIAADLSHDEDVITAFFDGILWVTLGRNPNLQAAVTLLQNAITGGQRAFSDLESAVLALAEQLQDRTCLIVIDDVWDMSHLKPFLRGGRKCSRLITTRDFRIAAEFVHISINEMRGKEATALLTRGIPVEDIQAFEQTARRLGKWPLLLDLANATLRLRLARGDTAGGALAYLNRALERRGVTRFDPLNEAKIARTIEVSLESLNRERQQYLEFAIFPENTNLPLTAVQDLCGLDEFEAEELVQSMHDLSLLQFDLQAGTFRLHDAVVAWLREQLPDPEPIHAKLLARWGDPRSLQNAYAWRYIGYHLVHARRTETLRELVLDFDWLQSKLAATDVNALLADCEYLRDDVKVSQVQAAIRLSAHILSQDKAQLAGQLLGRIPPKPGEPLNVLIERAANWHGAAWLRPLNPSLTPAGGPLSRTIIVGNTGKGWVGLTSTSVVTVCTAEDGEIQEWDLESGARTSRRKLSGQAIGTFLLLGRGRALSTTENAIKLWDLDSETAVCAFEGHTATVTCLAATADETHVISGAADGTVRIWRTDSGLEACRIPAHEDRISSVCVLQDSLVLSGSRDGKLRLWDLRSGKKVKSFLARGRVSAATVTADGRWIAAGLSDGTIKLWNAETGEEVWSKQGHGDRIAAIRATPDARSLVSASWDGTLRLWNLSSGSEVYCMVGHTAPVTSVGLTADGSVAVSLSFDGTLKLWDLKRCVGNVVHSGHTDMVTAVCANPRLGQVLSASRDGTIRVWDGKSGRESRSMCSHGNHVTALALSSDGRRVLSASRDGTVKLWDAASGDLVRPFHGHTSEVTAVALSRDGLSVITAADDRTVRVWDIESGAELRRFTPHPRSVTAIAIGERGKVFSGAWDSGSWDGALKLWMLDSGAEIFSFGGLADSVTSVATTVDFSRAISGCWDGTAKIWNLDDGSELLCYARHADSVLSVALTYDGKYAVTTSSDRTAHVWESLTGRLVAQFSGDAPMTTCAVVGDEPTIVVGDASGVLHFLRLEQLHNEAQAV